MKVNSRRINWQPEWPLITDEMHFMPARVPESSPKADARIPLPPTDGIASDADFQRSIRDHVKSAVHPGSDSSMNRPPPDHLETEQWHAQPPLTARAIAIGSIAARHILVCWSVSRELPSPDFHAAITSGDETSTSTGLISLGSASGDPA